MVNGVPLIVTLSDPLPSFRGSLLSRLSNVVENVPEALPIMSMHQGSRSSVPQVGSEPRAAVMVVRR